MVYCKKCKKEVMELINFKIGGTVFQWCENCCIRKNEEIKNMNKALLKSTHL